MYIATVNPLAKQCTVKRSLVHKKIIQGNIKVRMCNCA